MEILFKSKTMGNLLIKEIDYNLAKEIIIKNHYSHKWNTKFGKINIGIFKADNPYKCLGVASFGSLMNSKSYTSICEDINQNQILELNRMWIDDCLGRNAETILISKSFKIIKTKYPYVKLIQSFADGRLGCGTIYKASNFKYYGYSKTNFFIDNETQNIYHKILLENTHRRKGFKETLNLFIKNKLTPVEVKTYRYIYALDKKYIKKIKLKEEIYPKYSKGMSEINYNPTLNTLCKFLAYAEIDKDDNIRDIKKYINDKYNKDEIEKSIKKAYENKFIKEYLKKTSNK